MNTLTTKYWNKYRKTAIRLAMESGVSTEDFTQDHDIQAHFLKMAVDKLRIKETRIHKLATRQAVA
jgi:hypothetical protein